MCAFGSKLPFIQGGLFVQDEREAENQACTE
jgi:hypothetical protein